MNLQGMIDAMGEVSRNTRSQYHLTLGKLIEKLEYLEDMPVVTDLGKSVTEPHSYRGYYSDLAMQETEDPITTKQLLSQLKNDVLNKEFEGYKGGDYLMGEDTPLWISEYGINSGNAVVDSKVEDGRFVLIVKNID